MLGSSDVIAFVATTQPERALEFYRDTLGLTFVADDGFALTFDANGTPLRIAKVARMTPAPATVLGWRVKDIAAAVAGLAGRGVRFERYDGLDQNGPACGDRRAVARSHGSAILTETCCR